MHLATRHRHSSLSTLEVRGGGTASGKRGVRHPLSTIDHQLSRRQYTQGAGERFNTHLQHCCLKARVELCPLGQFFRPCLGIGSPRFLQRSDSKSTILSKPSGISIRPWHTKLLTNFLRKTNAQYIESGRMSFTLKAPSELEIA